MNGDETKFSGMISKREQSNDPKTLNSKFYFEKSKFSSILIQIWAIFFPGKANVKDLSNPLWVIWTTGKLRSMPNSKLKARQKNKNVFWVEKNFEIFGLFYQISAIQKIIYAGSEIVIFYECEKKSNDGTCAQGPKIRVDSKSRKITFADLRQIRPFLAKVCVDFQKLEHTNFNCKMNF